MEEPKKATPKPFLGVFFKSCKAYGRFYKNKENTAYIGRCPKCGKSFKVAIGSHGTNSRFFEATCN